ncbi:MAG: Bug family tripartite tricarboxylate transporter substrate binding protein [Rhodospirillaceae bacterium]
MKKVVLAFAGVALLGGLHSAQAQNWPTKPVRFIVPFTPGGGNDTIARLIGQKLTAVIGQQVIIDNRAGAGGTIGAEAAARSAPDGYTMFLAGVATHGINPNLRKKLPYDPVKDFEPVSLIAQAPLLVVVHPSLPVRNTRDLIALAKAKPGQVTYASNGAGGSSHMAVELFNMMTNTKMLHVPYKGLSPALTDLISGQVQVMFSSAVAMLPQVKAGRLRAIAMTGSKRSPALPELPTVAESGVPGYETGSWYGVVMPAGTPKPIVNRLAKEIATIAKSPEINERLVDDAAIPVGSTPEEFGAFIRKELARWAKVVQQGHISVE